MLKIEIKPLEGIAIENIGTVLLGQHKDDLYKLLGPPSMSDTEERFFYDELEVRFDVNQSQTIEFIEFIYGPFPENVELEIYGVNPFTVGANKLLEILTVNNNGEVDQSESPYSYSFLNTSIGVWREVAPKDVELATDELSNDTVKEKKEMAQNFWTIGLGVADYFRL